MANACVMDEPQEQMPNSRQLGQPSRLATSAGNSTKHFLPRSYLDRPVHLLALTGYERKDHMRVIDDPPTCVSLALVFIKLIDLLDSMGTLDHHPIASSC